MATSRGTIGQARFSHVPPAPPRRAILLWLTVLKPLKTVTSADRPQDSILAPHGAYVRGKAIRSLLNGHATRNHRAGPFFSRAAGASREGGSAVVNCAKTTKNGGECRSLPRSNTSAARDLRPKKGDSNPIEWPR